MYGRIVRGLGRNGLALLFYEKWVTDIDLIEYDNGNPLDLDRPRGKLRPNSSIQEHAGFASVQMVKSNCIRFCFSKYLNDTTDEGGFL